MQIWFPVDDYRIMNHVLKLVRTTVFSQKSDFKPWPFRMAKKKGLLSQTHQQVNVLV